MPSVVVTALLVWLVSRLVKVTDTFGNAAPDGSVRVPASAPVPADCAPIGGAHRSNSADANVKARWKRDSPMDFILSPFLVVSFPIETLNATSDNHAPGVTHSVKLYWEGVYLRSIRESRGLFRIVNISVLDIRCLRWREPGISSLPAARLQLRSTSH